MRPASGAIFAIFCMLSGTAAQAGRPIVAVFDVDKDRRIRLPRATLLEMANYLSTRLTESGRYQVIPRDQLKKRLVQQKTASYKDCYDQSCQIAIGKELAAEKSLSTRIGKMGSRCTVNLKLFDLRKSTTEAAASQHGKCTEDGILDSLDKALAKLFGENAAKRAAVDKAYAAQQAAADKERLLAEAKENYALANQLIMNNDKAGTRVALRKSCEGGLARACLALGGYLLQGTLGAKTKQDAELGFKWLKKACDGGDVEGCVSLGLEYELGRAVAKDPAKAISLFEAACDKGSTRGCQSGASYYAFSGPSDERNAGKAAALNRKQVAIYKADCGKGSSVACFTLASFYENGLAGLPEDPEQAAHYRAKQKAAEEAMRAGRASK